MTQKTLFHRDSIVRVFFHERIPTPPPLPQWVNWPEVYRTRGGMVSVPAPVWMRPLKQWRVEVPGWCATAGWARPDGAKNSDTITNGYDRSLVIARMKAHYNLIIFSLRCAWTQWRNRRRGWSFRTHQHLPGYHDTPFDNLDWYDGIPAEQFFRHAVPHFIKHVLRVPH